MFKVLLISLMLCVQGFERPNTHTVRVAVYTPHFKVSSCALPWGEPPRVCRRLFSLSYAATGHLSRLA